MYTNLLRLIRRNIPDAIAINSTTPAPTNPPIMVDDVSERSNLLCDVPEIFD